MASFRSLLSRLLKFLYLAPLQDAFIPLKDLPLSMQALGLLGYLSLFFMLVLMVIAAVGGGNWRAVTFDILDVPVRVPLAVQVMALVGLFVSWAYLLTGAAGSHPLVFLPLCLLFGAELFFLGAFGKLVLAWICLLIPLVLAVGGLHLFTRKKAFWRKYPLLEFGFWSLLLLLAGALFWLGRDPQTGLGTILSVVLDPFYVLLYPLWLLFGLSIVDLAVTLARWAVGFLRSLFPAEALTGLAAFVLLARLAAIPLWIGMAARLTLASSQPELNLQSALLPAAMLLDIALSFPLLAAAGVLALTHRWDGYHTARLLALCLAAPIFALGLILALSGRGDLSNPLELTLSSVGTLPSMVVFVVMLTYNVLGVGTKFTRTEGRFIPRHGRILILLGLALLVASLATYRVNLLEVATLQPANDFVNSFGNIFAISVVGLGLPYLLWIIWKRPERLAGSREEFEAVPARFHFPDRFSRQAWVIGGVVAGMLLCSLACVGALVSFYL
jgi:hypothetical protein